MERENGVSLDEFKKALTPENVRVMQMINLAMGMCTFAFLVVVVVLHFQSLGGAEDGDTEVSLLKMLSLADLVFALMCFTSSKLVYDLVFKVNRHSKQASTAEGCFGIIRTAGIIRLALMEGAAFFGLVVCLLGAIFGQLKEFPIYWLNVLPCLAMIAFIVVSFPSKAGLESVFQDKFLQDYRHG